jgi:pimeloyl-ACP methyl ester carboxylesterase
LQSIIDIPGHKYYEMISFDPRGIGASEPRVDCYPANDVARRAKVLEATAAGALNLSSASFDFGYYTARALGKRCEMTNAHILPFVNTPSVARDMLAMVDKVAELRKEQTIKQQKTDIQSETRKGEGSPDNIPRIQYYGLSYGTILGNYFASLFPGRVGRMVLDGVADSDDWANGPVSTESPIIYFARC